MECHSGRPLGDQRQHHVAAVAVDEPRAGYVLHRVTVQDGEELLGGRQFVDRHGQDVVVVVVDLVLVEVVADARTVGEELLDVDPVVDQRQVGPEHRSGSRVQAELAALHQAHHRERREPLGAAGDRELRVDRRRDAETPVRQPVRPLPGEAAVEVDPDHTRQALLGGDSVDQVAQPVAVVTSESHASQVTHRGERTPRPKTSVFLVSSSP
jgi:hypothetical protein